MRIRVPEYLVFPDKRITGGNDKSVVKELERQEMAENMLVFDGMCRVSSEKREWGERKKIEKREAKILRGQKPLQDQGEEKSREQEAEIPDPTQIAPAGDESFGQPFRESWDSLYVVRWQDNGA